MPINEPFEFFIQLHLTEKCNLRCRHCYQQGGLPDEMSLPEIKSVINETSDMLNEWKETYHLAFTSSFNVTGGEPFLRNDFFAILDELRCNGFDAFILSNGTLIGRDQAATLAGLAVKGVQVSIEGPEHIHDSIRGPGSFTSSIKGIRNLLEAGIPVTLNTTLSGMNADCFMDVVDLAASLGVQRVGFSRLVPTGRGGALLDTMISRETLKDLYNDLFSFDAKGLSIVTGDPVASQLRKCTEHDGKNPFPSGGCAAGVSGLTILPDGTVTPCRRLPVPIGNVKKDSLREIWATSEVLQGLRDKSRYAGRCGECSKWSGCRGCRAIAFAFSGASGKASYLAEDPQCFLPHDETKKG
jgi:radical SAM protein with 4Fe4S-binding SPASM domain